MSPAATTVAATPQLLKFVSKAADGAQKVAYATVTTPTDTTQPANQQTTPAVLVSNNTNTPAAAGASATQPATQFNLLWVPFVGSGLGMMILLAEEVIRRRGAATVAKTGTIATV